MPDAADESRSLGRTEAELRGILERGETRCALCLFAVEAVRRFVDNLFYENVNDPPTRDRIRAGGGFCRYHAQMVSTQSDALGTAIILEDVVKSVLRDIERGGVTGEPPSSPLLRLFDNRPEKRDREPCVICVAEVSAGDLALDALCRLMSGQAGLDLFGQSHGLCIPHFRRATERHRDQPCWPRIAEVERRALGNLAVRLNRLARSYDYQSTEEPAPEVRRAWREGLNITSSWIDVCRR